ncbi:hypothetical protein EG872_16435 [Enterococcus faecalis]|nr:hypothetical protein EG877_16680 [Enterococcus faecalis]RXF37916.1 hypothetical protein EG872_16435 [Enterococcus faecalis]
MSPWEPSHAPALAARRAVAGEVDDGSGLLVQAVVRAGPRAGVLVHVVGLAAGGGGGGGRRGG